MGEFEVPKKPAYMRTIHATWASGTDANLPPAPEATSGFGPYPQQLQPSARSTCGRVGEIYEKGGW